MVEISTLGVEMRVEISNPLLKLGLKFQTRLLNLWLEFQFPLSRLGLKFQPPVDIRVEIPNLTEFETNGTHILIISNRSSKQNIYPFFVSRKRKQ